MRANLTVQSKQFKGIALALGYAEVIFLGGGGNVGRSFAQAYADDQPGPAGLIVYGG